MIAASFDLDGTLVDSHALINKALTERGYVMGGQDSFQLEFIGRKPPEDFQWDLFFYRLFTERFDEIKPVDDYVVDFIQEVFDYSHDPVRIITARPVGALMHHCTSELLRGLFPGVDFSIDVVDSDTQKHRYMFGTKIIFEDRRRTAKYMSNMGYTVYLRNTPYNKMLRGETTEIKNVGPPEWVKQGTIVTFDSFSQLHPSRALYSMGQ